MREIVLAFVLAGTLCVGGALAQRAPAVSPPAFLNDPWREGFRTASPVGRAQMLLAKGVWDEDLQGNAYGVLVSEPDGRDVLLRATHDASACNRVTSSVNYLRAVLRKDTAAGEHYWFEGTYTREVIERLRTAASAQGACAATRTEIEALASDRVAWAQSRPTQQKQDVRITAPAAPRAGAAGSGAQVTPPGRTASGSSACPPGPVNPTMRALCDRETIEANRRVNNAIHGRPSSARDACYKALEDEMRRTNNRLSNFPARYEACRRMK